MEAVLLVPVLMLVLLVAVQCVLWAHAAQVAQLAASEGDRIARGQGGTASVAVATAQAVAGAPGSSMADATVGATPIGNDEVEVTVDAKAVSILPWLTLPVHAAAAGPVQTYRVSG